ncbi:GIY-YIG nuclease family protein [Halobacillus litoralis]|uniref:GIY-YIG nuclease family protein n=1 Tax=Halobacillus litoralis TaxID=45668 RepID=A0A845DW90_9BACI|nr:MULTISPECIES: GIY-YIG nuclease family protein [Halobacillus]MYL21953.1 GIY-YIG nuclease family protein [Halobacillus litoralis]MYL31919.1 GIY-YIG nuclease family protein [Halobacillus halophilus]MYL39753.1 GIY-YIG nuclease family protein [Halobacillus litoralis]
MAGSHYVYMLRCGDGSLYTGYTNNLEDRLQKHREGKGAKYTRGRGPLVLEAWQCYDQKKEAMREEYRLKQLARTKKERWIAQRKEEAGEDSKEL